MVFSGVRLLLLLYPRPYHPPFDRLTVFNRCLRRVHPFSYSVISRPVVGTDDIIRTLNSLPSFSVSVSSSFPYSMSTPRNSSPGKGTGGDRFRLHFSLLIRGCTESRVPFFLRHKFREFPKNLCLFLELRGVESDRTLSLFSSHFYYNLPLKSFVYFYVFPIFSPILFRVVVLLFICQVFDCRFQ